MATFLATLPKPDEHLKSVLNAAHLSEFSELEIRVGYFGMGNRLHVFIGNSKLRDGKGVWMKACEGFSWYGFGKPFTFGNEEMDRGHQLGALANCWRCAKMLGVIDRYPGQEERRRVEREGGPFASHQDKTKDRS